MIIIKIFTSFRSKMLFIFTITAFIICSNVVYSQISEGGYPPSFNYPQTLRSGSPAIKVPIDFYIEDLRETDQWQAGQGAPMPVSRLISVDYSMENSGEFTLLPGGEKIWRLHLMAKDAVAIMLYYNDFYIPVGGQLFIYNPDKSQLLGAYTYDTHPSGGLFASEFVGGEELILEYVVSESSTEKPRIAISKIGYGYNTAALRTFCGISTRAAGNCNVNINCEEGQAWQHEKKSICNMVQNIGAKGFICSASLMNNTAEDFKPLILTAAHCGYDGSTFASARDMEQWMFYFNKELEGCSNNSRPKVSQTLVGCTLLANTGKEGGSDGMLLLLKNSIPNNYDVFFNGWDRRDEASSSGASIHHPQGDYKKISTFDEPAISYTFRSDFDCETLAHWNVLFKATDNGHGVTEGGSSGSPLFNENKLVVGTLTGGSASCNYPRLNNLYGKLNYHWDRYKTDSTRMDIWLDPLNTGVQTLSGRFHYELKPSPRNLNAFNIGFSVSLTWDAPQSAESPKGYNVYRNNTKLFETTTLSFIDTAPLTGSITYSVSAVYDDEEESGFTSTNLNLIKYKAPSNLRAERSSSSDQVNLSWKAPLYEQTIFWGSLQVTWRVLFEEPVYFGQLWSVGEIAPLHNKTIKAIQFVPYDNNAYDICISQGERYYRQSIGNSTLRQGTMNTIDLTTPFVIDGSQSLLISVYLSGARTLYSVLCDDGPVVNGKGNLVSVDGIEWYRLNDDDEIGEYNFNFVLTAIVSSENGNLSSRSKNTDFPILTPVIRTNNSPLQANKSALPLNDNPVSLRNSIPTAFPEITKYRIYRSGSFHKEVSPTVLTYTDTYLSNSYYYQVSAFYDQFESEKSEIARIMTVNNDFINTSIRILPTQFTNYITLQGYENVSRIEVISVSGKVMMVVNHPNQQINTSSLLPGLYFFRIYDNNNRQFVFKAVRGI